MHTIKNISSKAPQFQYIIGLFLCTRIVLMIIGIFSRQLLSNSGLPHAQNGASPYLPLAIWGVWDTRWYLDIAENGYSFIDYNHQSNIAFFPLYPILVKILGMILSNKYYIAGLLISNVCLIAACIFLYKLIVLNSDHKLALRSIRYLFLFPVAFILSGMFTESLYLFLAIFCFYSAKKQRWLMVGIAGCLLALTRSLGVMIFIPMLWEYFASINFQIKKIKFNILYLVLIPMGLLIFILYNFHLTEDFFAFKNIQAAFDRDIENPSIISTFIFAFHAGIIRQDPKSLFEILFTIASLSILLISVRQISVSYLIFGLYSILIPLLTATTSMPRYILPIFPLYIILAKASQNRYIDQLMTVSLGLLQGFLMVFWSYGLRFII